MNEVMNEIMHLITVTVHNINSTHTVSAL